MKRGIVVAIVGIASFLVGSPVGPQYYPATWLGIALFIIGIAMVVRDRVAARRS